MRFLADEGCDMAIVSVLRELGHEVAWIAELAPSTSDKDILAWALREKRLIVHHDLDFGELIFRDNLPSYGVILVRIPDTQRELRAGRIKELLERYDESTLAGAITRLTAKRITQTPINADKRRVPPKNTLKTPINANKLHQAQDSPMNFDVPRFEDWKSFAMSFDGESMCRQMGIRPTAWYAQQMKAYKQTGMWKLSLLELRLMLYLEANKVKYNGGVENRERIESLLTAMMDKGEKT
jgi:predicted nuclease of predicted toxin-antitoxin system